MKRLFLGIFVAALFALYSPPQLGQDYIGSSIISAPASDVVTLFGPGDLDQMLGPVALYPDPLLAELLPAAMNPAEVVEADRYLQGGGDPNLIDAQNWTSSVKAMAHYPDLIKWMDENIAWTTQVGQAFRNQYQDVMNSIQRLRAQAQSLGNLQSTPQQTVVVDSGVVEIVPANPEIIYVPAYDPAIIYHRRAIIGGPFINFGIGFSIGAWLNRDWDWHNHRVVIWDRNHFRPHDWWYRPPRDRFRASPDFRVWQPRAPQRIWRPEDRGFETRHEPVRIVTPRPREVVRTESSRREPVRVEPARPEIRREPEPRREPERVERRAPETRVEPRREVQRAPSAPAPHSNGALVGVGSAPETRAYSSRGQQSRENQQRGRERR
jgi:hypothetical protein